MTADVTFEPASDTSQVLRELTPEEASLFYADYSLYRALREKILPLSQSGKGPFETPGGVFYKVADGLAGLGIKVLTLMALREFSGDARLEGHGRTVRVELVDDALCFTAVSLDPKDMAEALSQAVKLVIVAGGPPPVAKDKNLVDENFNLEAWNPDGKKFQ